MTARPNDPKQPLPWRAWKARNRSRRWYWRYPRAVEWALEWAYYRLRSMALFDLLELAGRCTVLVVAILWVLEAGDRAKERHYRAWDLINSARGSGGDGGRRDALQDLNRDGIPLAAAPLEHAYLGGIDLQGATLWSANMEDAYLEEANLRGADLFDANLQRAVLSDADLQSANLRGANMEGAYLSNTNLQGADLQDANLQGLDCNLSNAITWGSAEFRNANLQGANLQGADLTGARNLTQEQLNAAFGDDQTQLPEGLTRPTHWSKAAGSGAPPPSQADEGKAPPVAGAPGSDK